MRVTITLLGWVMVATNLTAQHPISYQVRLLTVDSNEGCDIGDIDRDGKPDIVAGRNWYRNGDWTPRPVRLLEDRAGYVRSNGEWLIDLDEDGFPDVMSMDFVQGGIYWFKNPGTTGLQRGLVWKKQLLADTGLTTNETSYLVDLTGDGRPEWISDQWNKSNPLIAWVIERPDSKQSGSTPEVPKLKGHRIGNSTGHGIGFGDLNHDGRDDIFVGTGWYECPAGNRLDGPWKFHPAWQLQSACPTLIYDVDGDGKNDVIFSRAHDFGIELWRSLGLDEHGELRFEKSTIDKSFSQAHCLHRVDLDGDGTDELLTGKRVRAHNGGDPGGKSPPVVRYYVWNQSQMAFQGHTIAEKSIGIGLQIRTADLDDDGDLDIVLAGKDGTQILFSQLK